MTAITRRLSLALLTYFLLPSSLFSMESSVCSTHSTTQPSSTAEPLLRKEIALARKKALYLIMDLRNGAITIKASGLPLRSYRVLNHTWLIEASKNDDLLSLTNKDPLIEPEPTRVPPPGAAIADDATNPNIPAADPLTVSDMPSRYSLTTESGIVINVHSVRTSSWLAEHWDEVTGSTVKWWMSLATWNSQGGVLWIEMTPEEAQALYWALVPPLSILLHPGPC